VSHLSRAFRHAYSKCVRSQQQHWNHPIRAMVFSVAAALGRPSFTPPGMHLVLFPEDSAHRHHSKPIARGIQHAAPAAHF
jgi:hypothetical protein